MFTNVIDCKDTNLFGIDTELTENYKRLTRAGAGAPAPARRGGEPRGEGVARPPRGRAGMRREVCREGKGNDHGHEGALVPKGGLPIRPP